MEFCKKCLDGDCSTHRWFNDLKINNEKTVLIEELRHIITSNILKDVVEKVYLVENQYNNYSHYTFSYVSGCLIFKVNVPTLAKNNDYYVPVMCYSGRDDVLNYQIEIKVELMRHNPMTLIVRKSIFDDSVLHEVELLSFNESLHMENMDDCLIIVKSANSRLAEFIRELEQIKDS